MTDLLADTHQATGAYPPPWHVPERYNIARDICDNQDPDHLAMVWRDSSGNRRDLRWAELQAMAAQFAHLLTAHGLTLGGRVAIILPPLPETAGAILGTLKAGGVLVMLSALWRAEAFAERLEDSAPTVVITDSVTRARVDQALEHGIAQPSVIVLHDELLPGLPTEFETVDTAAEDPAQICYTSGTPAGRKGSCTPTGCCSATTNSTLATICNPANCSMAPGIGPGPC